MCSGVPGEEFIAGLWATSRVRRSAPPGGPQPVHRLARNANQPLPVLWSVPPFQLVDQNGQTRTPEDLRGSVWIAAFIFTRALVPETKGRSLEQIEADLHSRR